MQEVKINAHIWNAVSEVQQQEMIAHLREHHILDKGDRLIVDARAPLPEGVKKSRWSKTPFGGCTDLCDVVGKTLKAFCTTKECEAGIPDRIQGCLQSCPV